MVALSLPKPVYMAREIYEAVHGLGTCEETLIEILCNVTNQEIHDMNAAYEKCKFLCQIIINCIFTQSFGL